MELRRDLWLGLIALVVFNLVMAFGTVGLMTRIGPAFERTLHDNVRSIQSAEQMLTVLAQLGGRAATPVESQMCIRDRRAADRGPLAHAARELRG